MIEQWRVNFVFDIIIYISKNVTLVKFMDTVINFKHSVSIVGYWIFDYKYKVTSIVNILIDSSVLSFGRGRNVCHV